MKVEWHLDMLLSLSLHELRSIACSVVPVHVLINNCEWMKASPSSSLNRLKRFSNSFDKAEVFPSS